MDYCKSDANARTQPNVNKTIINDQPKFDSGPLANEEPIFPMLSKEQEE